MKNVKNLFGMAVMPTALVGCSSNDNLNPNANEGADKAGTAYASFKINLPTTNGTRAVDSKTGTEFDGGTAAEYEVKNGTILIFDNSGKFVESVPLGTMNPWTDVKKDGVTTAAIATVKLNKVSVGGNYQALVLLNNDVDATTKKVTLPTATTDTYENWSKDISKVNADNYAKTTDGIFMANAPMYTSKTTEPTTLVKIKKVCASPEEAQATAATVVYVERGLAKVTMNDFTTSGYSISGGTYDGATVKIEKWQLDVTNKSTFPVHQIYDLSSATNGFADIWKTDRFYDGTTTAFQRVYWGVDPNYDNTDYLTLSYCKNAFNMIKNKDVKGDAGSANPQYCLENTFNLANMMQGQTTRVVFKAVFTPKDFTSSEKTFYKIGNNTAIWSKENLEKQIKAVAVTVMKLTSTEEADYEVKLDAPTNKISGEAGQHMITADNIVYTGSGSSKVPAALAAINAKLGLTAEAGISTYLNGEAYYIARIKHFNALTPWNPGEAYGSKNNKYLGRYGVLRNNWYSLSVNKVSGLGYPEVPEVKPNVPDDENDQYINVEVKILDWAKRSQSIDL